MANQTVSDAKSIRGTDPQLLIEKIVRTRIYDCRYWKEECFALTAELLVDNAMKLRYVGGVYGGNVKPTPFICLLLKMLQIQPEKDIIVEFITQPDFKYVRTLGAMYMRMTGSSIDCYKYLEPLYLDYRKVRAQGRDGKFFLTHVDEFVDELLTEERSCDTILPRIMKRSLLEEDNKLDLRTSVLLDELNEVEEDASDDSDYRKSASPYTKRRNERIMERDRNRYPRAKEDKERDERTRAPREDRHEGKRDDRRTDRRDDRRTDRHRRDDRKERDDRKFERRDDRKGRDERSHRDRDGRGRNDDRERTRRRRSQSPEHKKSKSDHKSSSHKSSKHRSSRSSKNESSEVKEANELRAKLGIAPLRP